MRQETPRPVMLYVENGMFIGKEMVFCKDCKYWEEESSGRTYCERTMFWINMDADDFCSRGEFGTDK